MSVFGGDSWGREAQQRKRRIDDLFLNTINNNNANKKQEDDSRSSSYKKLSNGKYTCLVCPNNPLFDTPLTLSIHNKGSRHIAAESRLKDRDLMQQEEIKKRIALSDNSVGSACSRASNQPFQFKCSPLIEQTRKAAFDIFTNEKPEQSATTVQHNVSFNNGSAYFFSPSYSFVPEQRTRSSPIAKFSSFGSTDQSRGLVKQTGNMLAEQHSELLHCRERELKFTAAGWKRDCHGKWYKDENVEFDSDEEDPNVCLL